jgi:hypothetical protein
MIRENEMETIKANRWIISLFFSGTIPGATHGDQRILPEPLTTPNASPVHNSGSPIPLP